jgi:hypothetical protein
MKKALFLVVPVCASFAFACKTESSTSTTTTTTTTGTAATATATTAATQPGIVDKALSFLGGGGPFEGEISMNVSDPGKPMKTITYEVKGTKLRFEAPESAGPMSGGYVIFDTTGKKFTAVNDAKKTAMVMDMGAMQGMMPGAPPGGPKPTVDKTGKTDTVAGYSCDVWKVNDPNGEHTDLCVAKGISFPAMGRHAGWMSSLEDTFPLRAVQYDSAGKEKSRMEVTKVDKKSLDDKMFEVPAGYQTQNMDDMMKAFGGGHGMGGFRPPH